MAHPRKGLFSDGPKEIAVVDKEMVEEMTGPQRRAIEHLSAEPQAARRGGSWSPIAAFNLVRSGRVKLHQSYTGDRYSLTPAGLKLQAALRSLSTPSMKDVQ